MVAGPRNHRQLTPDRSRGRESLLVRCIVAERQHGGEISMELGINAIRGLGRWGEHDPVDQRAQYLAGFGLDAIVVERQFELGHFAAIDLGGIRVQPDDGWCLGAPHDCHDLGLAGLQRLHPLLQSRGVHAIFDGRHDAGNLPLDSLGLALPLLTAGGGSSRGGIELLLEGADELGHPAPAPSACP